MDTKILNIEYNRVKDEIDKNKRMFLMSRLKIKTEPHVLMEISDVIVKLETELKVINYYITLFKRQQAYETYRKILDKYPDNIEIQNKANEEYKQIQSMRE